MNTKYILLLLPFVLISNTNALSLGKNLEEKRDNWRKCRLSIKATKKMGTCRQYEEEYKKARDQFIKPLINIEKTPINRPYKIFSQDNADKRMLLAHAASGLRETLQGRRELMDLWPFEETNETLEEYCTRVLNKYLDNRPLGRPSSAVSNRASHNGFTTIENMPIEKLEEARQYLLEVIKQQSL